MTMQLAQKRALDSPIIPDRLYFKIGDVARICELETYVLRFWESQFPQLKPNKSGTGQRLYRRRDVELVLAIKRLVHAEGYTISGARQVLEQVHRRPGPQLTPHRAIRNDSQSRLPLPGSDPTQQLSAVAATIGNARAELREIVGLLSSPVPIPPRRRPRFTPPAEFSGSLFTP
ncbi:MAG: MerR family transcriptional regulator [Terracidiphilus sp.]|jgi:DNA-binding transcriptional MerR regulator